MARNKTADSWKAAKTHTIVCPSGFEVEIKVPNLPELVKTGYLPNELVTQALKTLKDTNELTADIVVQQAEFYNKLIAVTVVNPPVSEEDVAELPFEDIELIALIATRQRDLDAIGQHIGGLHTNKRWRAFRGLDLGDEDVEGQQGG